MKNRTPSCYYLAFALIGLFLLLGVAYLTFLFPKTLQSWADQQRDLTSLDRTLANLSDFCRAWWYVLIPIFGLDTAIFGIWGLKARASEGKD